MTPTPLAALARRRLESLDEIDRLRFPALRVSDPGSWPAMPPSLAAALRRPAGAAVRILAEVKRASPSAGRLSSADPVEICRQYVEWGVHGVSVLTDPVHFDGDAEHLQRCHRTFPDLPLLFKDFVLTPYQVDLARACGASAVLLMTQLLDAAQLRKLFTRAVKNGLEPFVEVHTPEQLKQALALEPPLIGINARDFETAGMPVDLETAPRLLRKLGETRSWPEHTVLVAQSGLDSMAAVRALDGACPLGLPDAIQVGTSLAGGGNGWVRELTQPAG